MHCIEMKYKTLQVFDKLLLLQIDIDTYLDEELKQFLSYLGFFMLPRKRYRQGIHGHYL